jgi:hypothetical protein
MRFRGGFDEEEVNLEFAQSLCVFAVKIMEAFYYLEGFFDDSSIHIGCNLCSVEADVLYCLLRCGQLALFSGYPVWCSGCFTKTWWIWGERFVKFTPC